MQSQRSDGITTDPYAAGVEVGDEVGQGLRYVHVRVSCVCQPIAADVRRLSASQVFRTRREMDSGWCSHHPRPRFRQIETLYKLQLSITVLIYHSQDN